MTRNKNKTLLTLATMLVAVVAMSSSLHAQTGDETIYEGFDYADNSNLEGASGGHGWSGGWDNVKNGAGSALTPGLSYGSLDAAGNAAGHGLWGTTHRFIGSALDGLMDDGDTLWFSLVAENSSTFNTDKVGFALADDRYSNSAQWKLENGTGIGVWGQNAGLVFPAMYTPGAQDTSLDSGSGIDISPAKLIVGKIEFGSGGADETLTLYTPDTAVDELGGAVAVNSMPDIDQSAFDRVSLLYKESSKIDEIRFGTYAGALGRIAGDNDNDKDVDTSDITASVIGFTGGGGSGGKWSTGDNDGDGDVDTSDVTTSVVNFTGGSAGAAGVPDVYYDPITGNITIDTDGLGDLGALDLQSAGDNFTGDPADFSGLPVGATDDLDGQLGWVKPPAVGTNGVFDLGNVMATGLSEAQFLADLAGSQYGIALGAGGGGGDLGLIYGAAVPEPSAMVLLVLGFVGLVARRRMWRAG